MTDNHLIELTADIVSAHVSNNQVATADVSALIQSVFTALTVAETPTAAEAPKQDPAVSVRSSVKHDYIICLEDGAKLKMLKRYLRTNFDMSPDEYRAKWNLPRDYPMVAPAYAETRRALAQKIGLGRKKTADAVAPAAKRSKKTVAAVVDAAQSVTKKRGRPAGVKTAKPTGDAEVSAEQAKPVDA